MTRVHTWAAALLVVVGASSARAQVLYGPASFWWEGSSDGGATWQGEILELPTTQTNVLVRARVAFPPEDRRYFGGFYTDVTVAGTAPGDDITNARNVLTNFLSWRVVHFPGLLKLDGPNDLDLPGQGLSWLGVVQTNPVGLPNPSFENPVAPLVFTLSLDGTPGPRVVDAVFRPIDVPVHLDRFLGTYHLVPGDFEAYVSPIETYVPLTIRVVPAPGTAGVIVGGLGLAARRRRGIPE